MSDDKIRINFVKDLIKSKTLYFDYDFVMAKIIEDKIAEQKINTDIDFDLHDHINGKMFTILLEWLLQVHHKFRTSEETLFLTHQVISRYLTTTPNIRKSKLQLVGIASYFLCSKYEDEYSVELKDIVYICDKVYTSQEIILMESNILKSFDYKLLFSITIANFLDPFLYFSFADAHQRIFVMYLCELSLIDIQFLKFVPSKIVATSIMIMRNHYKRIIWNNFLEYHTGYTKSSLSDCVIVYKDIILNPKINKTFLINKYSRHLDNIHTLESTDWNKLI